jgi:ubiquinone/menaquinone biosynthesis C-methylase UbiE
MSARKTESRGPAELGVSVSAGSGHRPSSNPDAQDRVTRVYDRVAQIYDIYDAPMEWLGGNRRRDRVLNRARDDVLEVGIGTGRNLEHYPPGVRLTGIDVSEAMLRREEALVPVRCVP